MKKWILTSALSFLVTSVAHANYICWDGDEVGNYQVYVDTKEQSYAVSALASCYDESNCEAPVINYQLSGGKIDVKRGRQGEVVISDKEYGPHVLALKLNLNQTAKTSRGFAQTCKKQKCFTGVLSGETSIKPGLAMEVRLKNGIQVTCINKNSKK